MDNTTPFQPWAADDNSKNVKTERELVDDAKLHRENVNHPKHRQTASYDKDIVDAPSVVPGPSSATGSGVNPVGGNEPKMDSSKVASMQQIVENTLSQEGRQRVSHILEAVEALSGAERLLLYLRLPTGVPPHDPLKQPLNPLGSRAELQQTVTWIQTHLEVDPDVSLPKQDVYDEYIAHCMNSNMKPLSTADFGKVMKQVYPSVRPRRLGTRGNSRYCYAGLRKKVKLEVPQLPDLAETSKEPTVMKESERIICEWAKSNFGIHFSNITELSRHLVSPLGPTSASPPPHPAHVPLEEIPGTQVMKQVLKRKIQTQTTPGRPKKNKGQEVAEESPPSASYVGLHPAVKHEGEMTEPTYAYQPAYGPMYDVRQPTSYTYAPAPRAHPPHAPPASHPAMPVHEYRPDPYAFEPVYAPRDLSVPPDTAHNLPINLSSDASLDLSTERGEWPRRRPPDPPAPHVPHAARLPLPGKKLILETYHNETQASLRSAATQQRPEEFPRTEYLPKKMRAAEILGGKLAASRQALAGHESTASSSSAGAQLSVRPEVAFLEDSKNLTSRSKSTAAALAREEQEAASPTRAVKAPAPKCNRMRMRKFYARGKDPSPDAAERPERLVTPDSCCGLDGINIKTGVICAEKHSEILNRERVISICNIDKHDLDDYLNEGNSQEHEEELLQYFHRDAHHEPTADANPADNSVSFLETGQDPHDDHSQGKSEKISQLRELLAKNLKNQSGSNAQNLKTNQDLEKMIDNSNGSHVNKTIAEGAFKPLGNGNAEIVNGTNVLKDHEVNISKKNDTLPNENGILVTRTHENNHNQLLATGSSASSHLYNGNCHNEPQSPTTRTQQYDFVPISDECHSPGNFHSKSPLGFGQRGHSPNKTNKPTIMGGSLQTSPISHSTAASPFVSPRNTPVPRSRFCSRPIPKHNGRKRRNPLTLGVTDPCSKQFAIPNDQKFMTKSSLSGPNIKYCQPMSAPPSPNILSHYKQQMVQNSGIPNGNSNLCLNFIPNAFRENINGELAQPLSADPLSSEVSRFFQEPVVNYRLGHDTSFRSQSVPLKQAPMNIGLLSYNNTPVGSVPQTPVPNEFCDFGSLADTCDISKAGLNPETLDKIYDAIDSSNGVLNAGASTNVINTNNALTNGCDSLPDQQILTEEQLHSLMPSSSELLGRSGQYSESFPNDAASADNVEEFLKRTNSIDYDLSELVTEKNKYYTSRSVPSTPLPYKRTAPNLQIDSRLSRELFTTENYSSISNGISSKSVPSTPQLAEDRSVFSYSNRDFLINGNSVDMCNSNQMRSVENDQGLTSPLDMLREDILVDPLTPSIDPLLADLDKMDGTPYVDL